jgi:glycosyltransferase involved in cell wall biosynthesis
VKPYRVIATTPYWHLNGVNTVSASLVRGLRAAGIEAEILLTDRSPRELCAVERPADVPMRQLESGFGVRGRIRALARDLAARAPCVYLPGYDYACSGVSGILPDSVVAVGVVHSDDPMHYAHVERLGRYWNATVCVSNAIEQGVAARFPTLRSRTCTIHNGVDLPSTAPDPGRPSGDVFEIVFASRIVQAQKRVFDLVPLLDEFERRDVRARLTVLGDGGALGKLRALAARHEQAGRVHFAGAVPHATVLAHFERAHVFLLTSDFEGLPISLLEAMARGCVPVVTDIPSGIPEVVTHRANGFRLPVGDMAAFADTIALLAHEPARRESLARAAIETVSGGEFNTTAMTAHYIELFERLFDEAARGSFTRAGGRIVLPPELEFMNRLRSALGHPRQRLRRLFGRG